MATQAQIRGQLNAERNRIEELRGLISYAKRGSQLYAETESAIQFAMNNADSLGERLLRLVLKKKANEP